MTPPLSMFVSWDRFHEDARTLAAKLHDRRFKVVVAITRGGLIPAAIIARELGIHMVDTFCASSYDADHKQASNLRVLKAVGCTSEAYEARDLALVVDDLADTGNTLRIVRHFLPRAHAAVVYAKPAGLSLADTYVTQVPQQTWIHFPWDTGPSFTPPLGGRD